MSYLVAFLQVTRECSGEECEGKGAFLQVSRETRRGECKGVECEEEVVRGACGGEGRGAWLNIRSTATSWQQLLISLLNHTSASPH